jgi:hypothetical protein
MRKIVSRAPESINLWSPFGPEVLGIGGAPPNAYRWEDERVRVDRLNWRVGVSFDPDAMIPWSTLTTKEYYELAEARGRRQVLAFTELDPGSQDREAGGTGYNLGIPEMGVSRFRRRVRKAKRWLGGRTELVDYVQGGNEIDFAPDIWEAGLTLDNWFPYNVERLKVLRAEFPEATVVSGGHTLVETFSSRPQFNWWAAERGVFEEVEGLVADTHWNRKSVAEARSEILAFRSSWPHVPVGCFENTSRLAKPEFAQLAVDLELVAYADFHGLFPSSRWGIQDTNKEDTSDLAIVGTRDERWIWNEANAEATTQTSIILGTFEGDLEMEELRATLVRQRKELRGAGKKLRARGIEDLVSGKNGIRRAMKRQINAIDNRPP